MCQLFVSPAVRLVPLPRCPLRELSLNTLLILLLPKLGFRRVATFAGSLVSPTDISFENSGGAEPDLPSIYNRRLTTDAIASTKV